MISGISTASEYKNNAAKINFGYVHQNGTKYKKQS